MAWRAPSWPLAVGHSRTCIALPSRVFAVANLPDAAVAALRSNPRVARIAPNGAITIGPTRSPVPAWGLDRIDAVTGLNQSYTYPNDGSPAHWVGPFTALHARRGLHARCTRNTSETVTDSAVEAPLHSSFSTLGERFPPGRPWPLTHTGT
jgi:hypothetical protein